MCGIYCSICSDGQSQFIDVNLRQLLQNRGRNHDSELCVKNVLFGGFVLWQQGSSVTPQPIRFGNWILLLNGDIFNKNDDTGFSDTTWLVRAISQCKTDADILELFKSLKGPYSVIFFNCTKDDLYFARDSLGRNSLIIERESAHLRILSNSHLFRTPQNKLCIELPPLGLFKVNLLHTELVTLFPWLSYPEKEHNDTQGLRGFFSEVQVQECIKPDWLLQSYDNHEPFDFYQLCNLLGETEEIYDLLLANESVKKSICGFLKLLRSSVKERVQFTPTFCNECIDNLKSKCSHSKVGILFSGGIDCTILAIVADEFVDADSSIDLINVAFEAHNAKEINWNVPDRCSAKESYEELTRLRPTRNWNLVEVNVTRKELNEKLESHIKHLIHPLNTVLDESLGCAFWFASRGQGFCKGQAYTSPTRVILIGSGADELFGGYTRHRNAFTRTTGLHADKLLSLSNELELDWQRLPLRNLGRDDRVIADNGKTSRAPFIQEDIVRFVRNLRPEQRCCFALAQGVGDKLFLRLSGYQLGLKSSVKLKKRAIQFGSRIANKNQNAKDVSASIQ